MISLKVKMILPEWASFCHLGGVAMRRVLWSLVHLIHNAINQYIFYFLKRTKTDPSVTFWSEMMEQTRAFQTGVRGFRPDLGILHAPRQWPKNSYSGNEKHNFFSAAQLTFFTNYSHPKVCFHIVLSFIFVPLLSHLWSL